MAAELAKDRHIIRDGTVAIAFLNLVRALGTNATADLQDLVRRDLTALARHRPARPPA